MPYSLRNISQSAPSFMLCFSIICHCQAGDTHFYYGPLGHNAGAHSVNISRFVDIFGNTRAVTTLSGAGPESWSYSPFGVRTIRDSIGNEIPQSAYGVSLGFGSRPPVKRLNTLDFHHRVYNERDGSFLTRDPLHYIDTHNERQYAMHNPIDLTDYHGLMSQGGQTTAQGASTGAPVLPLTGNPTGDGEKPNRPDICVNGGTPATTLPWVMQNVQLQNPEEYERHLRQKLDELIEQHGEDIITAHENGTLVPWARPPQYVIWLLNGDRPAFQAAMSTQSQADLAKVLINARKPKPHEPGGWAFNALGPNGAAYELIAVFAGVTAAPRVFQGRTSARTVSVPTSLLPRRPQVRAAGYTLRVSQPGTTTPRTPPPDRRIELALISDEARLILLQIEAFGWTRVQGLTMRQLQEVARVARDHNGNRMEISLSIINPHYHSLRLGTQTSTTFPAGAISVMHTHPNGLLELSPRDITSLVSQGQRSTVLMDPRTGVWKRVFVFEQSSQASD